MSRGGGSNKRERRNIFCLGLSSMLIDQYGKRESVCVGVCMQETRKRIGIGEAGESKQQ